MNRDDRKAAIAAYKDRKRAAGIYALRCRPADLCWVGSAPDLRTIRNRHWFSLRHGASPHRTLQAAWRTHGESAFTFEALERLDERLSEFAIEHALEERLAHWQVRLQAEVL